MRPTTTRRDRKPNSEVKQEKATIDFHGLNKFVGYQLLMAYVAISRHFMAAMAKLDLTQKQTGVLWLIGANSGVSQIALATEFGMDRASMMAIIDRLEERGLVARKRSSQDGRRQELHVTAKGRKVLAQAKAALVQHEMWITERFSGRELNGFVNALKRIHG